MKKPVLQFSIPSLNVKEEGKPPTFEYVFYELPFPEPFPEKPIQSPPFFISTGWANGKGEFEQEVKIISPDSKTLIETGKQKFKLSDENTPQLMINKFEGVIFEKTGTYKIEVYLDNEKIISYPLTIRSISKSELDNINKKIDEKEEKEEKKVNLKQDDQGFLAT